MIGFYRAPAPSIVAATVMNALLLSGISMRKFRDFFANPLRRGRLKFDWEALLLAVTLAPMLLVVVLGVLYYKVVWRSRSSQKARPHLPPDDNG